MISQAGTHITNSKWLAGVRQDLDSRAEDWVGAGHAEGLTKAAANEQALDIILTELGHPAVHSCPDCGAEHKRAR